MFERLSVIPCWPLGDVKTDSRGHAIWLQEEGLGKQPFPTFTSGEAAPAKCGGSCGPPTG